MDKNKKREKGFGNGGVGVKERVQPHLDDGDVILKTPSNVRLFKKGMSLSFTKGLLLAFVVAFLLCFIGFLILAMRPKIQSVILLDGTTGAQTTVGAGNVTTINSFSPGDALFMNVAKTYITNLRSVSSDDVVNRQRMEDVYAYSTGDAVQVATTYFKEYNPIVRGKNERVDVSIYSSLLIKHNETDFLYQIDWSERTFDLGGRKLTNDKSYRADIICRRYRATEETKDRNPLGLYVTQIRVSPIEDGRVVNTN